MNGHGGIWKLPGLLTFHYERSDTVSIKRVGALTGLLFLIASWVFAASSPFKIQMESWSPYYTPAAATVMARSAIRWENPTATHHTVTHDGCKEGGICFFDSGSIPPAGVYEIQELPPGRYPYHCALHPVMRGMLIVTSSDHSSEI